MLFDLTVLKLRLWAGIGLGIMPVYYRDMIEVWIIFPFFRLRVHKERKN